MSVVELIEKAVKNPENINEDGSINWNFVDADIHLDNSEFNLGYTSQELFEGLNSYDG